MPYQAKKTEFEHFYGDPGEDIRDEAEGANLIIARHGDDFRVFAVWPLSSSYIGGSPWNRPPAEMIREARERLLKQGSN